MNHPHRALASSLGVTVVRAVGLLLLSCGNAEPSGESEHTARAQQPLALVGAPAGFSTVDIATSITTAITVVV